MKNFNLKKILQTSFQTSLQNILQSIAQKQLQKIQKQYQQIHQETIPIVVIVGTVGKSSLTMMINQLFQNNNYQVISGTSQTKNLNSLTGLVMTLGGFYVELSQGWKFLKVAELLSKGFLSVLSPNYDLSIPTSLILEVGYDYQNESDIYLKIFENIDLLVVSSCTWEHNQGFNTILNTPMLNKILPELPQSWQTNLSNNLIDVRLRNIAIEQLNLIQKSQHTVLPENIGQISNTIIANTIDQNQFSVATATPSRINGILISDKYIFNGRYFLPNTFARTSLVLEAVANVFEFETQTVKDTINSCELPFGRFGRFVGKNNTTIIDSTYNSDPASLNGFLDNLEEVINNPTKFGLANNSVSGHILIFGEMRELGITAKQEHNNILDRIVSLQEKYGKVILEVLFIGSEWHKLNKQPFIIFESASKICEYLDSKPQIPDSWYWIKGSQNTIFLETVTKHLLQNTEDSQYLCRQEAKWNKL